MSYVFCPLFSWNSSTPLHELNAHARTVFFTHLEEQLKEMQSRLD